MRERRDELEVSRLLMVTVEGTGGLGDETKVEAKEQEGDDTADFETKGDSKTENDIKKQNKRRKMLHAAVTHHCKIKVAKRSLLPIHEGNEVNVEPNAERAIYESEKVQAIKERQNRQCSW
jgi:hypothetical protein